jgi:hypothetical protein
MPFGPPGAFRSFSPSGKVPCLVDGDTVVWDSLAIVEYLAERHAGVWPASVGARQQGAGGRKRSINTVTHSASTSLLSIVARISPIQASVSAFVHRMRRGGGLTMSSVAGSGGGNQVCIVLAGFADPLVDLPGLHFFQRNRVGPVR